MGAFLRKMWAQIGGALATLVYSLITDGGILGIEWAVLLTQGVTIILVWYVDNTGRAPYAKGMSAAWSAASVVFMLAVPDGITTQEWGQIGLAAITALVVLMVPNGAARRPVVAGEGTVRP